MACPPFPEFCCGAEEDLADDEAELMEERVDTVETGDRVLIRVVSCTAELPDPPDSELRPLSLLLWAWWLLLMFPPPSRRDGLAAAKYYNTVTINLATLTLKNPFF